MSYIEKLMNAQKDLSNVNNVYHNTRTPNGNLVNKSNRTKSGEKDDDDGDDDSFGMGHFRYRRDEDGIESANSDDELFDRNNFSFDEEPERVQVNRNQHIRFSNSSSSSNNNNTRKRQKSDDDEDEEEGESVFSSDQDTRHVKKAHKGKHHQHSKSNSNNKSNAVSASPSSSASGGGGTPAKGGTKIIPLDNVSIGVQRRTLSNQKKEKSKEGTESSQLKKILEGITASDAAAKKSKEESAAAAAAEKKGGKQSDKPKEVINRVIFSKYIHIDEALDRNNNDLYETSCDEYEHMYSEDESGSSSSDSESDDDGDQCSERDQRNGNSELEGDKRDTTLKRSKVPSSSDSNGSSSSSSSSGSSSSSSDVSEPEKHSNHKGEAGGKSHKGVSYETVDFMSLIDSLPTTSDLSVLKTKFQGESRNQRGYHRHAIRKSGSSQRKKKRKNKKGGAGKGGGGGDDPFDQQQDTVFTSRFDRSACFGCMWGSPKDAPIETHAMNQCLQLISENYGFMDNAALARLAHIHFKHNLFLPALRSGKRIPMWRSSMILAHIEGHTLESKIFVGESINKFKKVMDVLYSRIMKEQTWTDGSVNDCFDERNLRLMVVIQKVIMQLYKSNPKQMNFHNDDVKINYERVGSLINLNKNFDILTKKGGAL